MGWDPLVIALTTVNVPPCRPASVIDQGEGNVADVSLVIMTQIYSDKHGFLVNARHIYKVPWNSSSLLGQAQSIVNPCWISPFLGERGRLQGQGSYPTKMPHQMIMHRLRYLIIDE